jgi:hypothetical protein
MSKRRKLLEKILLGRSDHAIDFDELCGILIHFGFALRVNGSHHIFAREDIAEILNLQPKGHEAKAYQVKQVRELILRHRLWSEDE